MYSLALANQLEQEVTIERGVIGVQDFECPDIECGAMFSYRRVSCGYFVQPEFCPTCGGPMGDAQQDGHMIVPVAAELSLANSSNRRQFLPSSESAALELRSDINLCDGRVKQRNG
jgi:predicted RNA-binding Zn-ribbon protein involved in translation (DUF1610 family)